MLLNNYNIFFVKNQQLFFYNVAFYYFFMSYFATGILPREYAAENITNNFY